MVTPEKVWKISKALLEETRNTLNLLAERIECTTQGGSDKWILASHKFTTYCPQPRRHPPTEADNSLHRNVFNALLTTAGQIEDEDFDGLIIRAPKILKAFLTSGLVRRVDDDSLTALCKATVRMLADSAFVFYVSVGFGATTERRISARLPGYLVPTLEFLKSFNKYQIEGNPRRPLIRFFSAATIGDLNGLDRTLAIKHAFYRFILLHEFLKRFGDFILSGRLRYEIFEDKEEHRRLAIELSQELESRQPPAYQAVKETIERFAERRESPHAVVYGCLHPIMFTDWMAEELLHEDDILHAVISYGGLAESPFRVIRRLCIEEVTRGARAVHFPINAMLVTAFHKSPPYNLAANDLEIGDLVGMTREEFKERMPKGDLGKDFDFFLNVTAEPASENQRTFPISFESYKDFLISFLTRFPVTLIDDPRALRNAVSESGVQRRLDKFSLSCLDQLN